MMAYRREGEPDIWLGGSGVRLTPYQKKRIRQFCLDRDGEKCMLCNRDERDLSKLEIDHINGDAGNNWGLNLQLAHKSCNSRAFHSRNYSGGKEGTLLYRTQRERTMLAPYQSMAPASVEVRLNREYEPLFRRRSFEIVKLKWSESGNITKTDLRVMVREFVGCSSQASYSYVERLFAPEIGPLIEDEDKFDGNFFVRFRYHKDLNLSIEDLEAKFPKSGQRFKKDANDK